MMKRLRDPQWVLILGFLGVLASVPLIQMLIEARGDEGIRAFDVFSRAPTAANLRAYEKGIESANWAAKLTRPWIQFAQFSWLGHGGEKAVLARDGWYFYKPGLNYKLARFDRAKPAAVATNDPVAAIVDFRDQLAAHGIHLLVMPAPDKESIYPDRLNGSVQPRGVPLAPRTRDLLVALRAAKVEVVDLFQVYGEARQEAGSDAGRSLYLAQDTHWSPAGVSLAARAVAQRLVALGWVKPGQVEYVEKPAPVQRLGDIVRMLQAPLIERSVSPETVACAQVVRTDTGQPYRDGADAEILVLGDSFMRIYQQDEPNAAGFIAHLARELKQPLMSLVNDGGGSTLVRQELRSRAVFLKKKKVVVWEFVERDIALGIEGWKRVRLNSPTSL